MLTKRIFFVLLFSVILTLTGCVTTPQGNSGDVGQSLSITETPAASPTQESVATIVPTPTVLPTPTPQPPPKSISADTIGEIKPLYTIENPKPFSVTSMAISGDGSLLAVGEFKEGKLKNTTIKIFKINAIGISPLTAFDAHTDTIRALAFSPDGKWLASGSWDKTIKIWSTVDWQPVQTLEGWQSDVYALAFSSDGKTLAGGFADQYIRLWNVNDWHLDKQWFAHDGYVLDIAFSPDNTKLVSGSVDKTVRLWNLAEGKLIRSLTGHVSAVYSVGFSPDGQMLFSAGDRTIRLWNVETGELIRVLQGHTGQIFGAAISPDGQTIVSAGDDITVRSWRVSDGAAKKIFVGHKETVQHVVFSPIGDRAFSAGKDGFILTWQNVGSDASSGYAAWSTHGMIVKAFSPDSAQMASIGRWDNSVFLWNVRDGSLQASFMHRESSVLDPENKDKNKKILENPYQNIYNVVYSHDGSMLASVGTDGVIRIWNATSHELIKSFEGYDWMMGGVKFSPDDQKIAFYWKYSIYLLELNTGKVLRKFDGHADRVTALIFSPDGSKLASGSQDKSVRIWDIESGKLLKTLSGHKGMILDLGFSPDGAYLVSGAIDGTARVWNVEDGSSQVLDMSDLMLNQPRAYNYVYLDFSPDGSLLVTSLTRSDNKDEGTLVAWDTTTWQRIAIIGNGAQPVFSPDGKYLATSSEGKVTVWGIP